MYSFFDENIVTKISFKEVEEYFQSRVSEMTLEGVNEWKAFLIPLLDGQEILHYESPPEDWDKGMGNEGYVIVDNEKNIIRDIVIRMN